jgi:hypothetical protein
MQEVERKRSSSYLMPKSSTRSHITNGWARYIAYQRKEV